MDPSRRHEPRRSLRLSSQVQSPTPDRRGRSDRPGSHGYGYERHRSRSPRRRSPSPRRSSLSPRRSSPSPRRTSPRGGSYRHRSPSPRPGTSGTQRTSQQTSSQETRRRGIRFSDAENLSLCEEVVLRFDDLYGRNSGKTDVATKTSLWRSIRSEVCAVEHRHRTEQQCRKRFADIKLRLRKKLSKLRQYAIGTGGGPPASLNLTDYEQVVQPYLMTEALYGIRGGYDADLPSSAASDEADVRSASGTDAGVVLLRRQSGDLAPPGPSAADVRSASGTDAGVVLLRRQSGDLAPPGPSAADVRSASGTDAGVVLLRRQSGDLAPPGPSAADVRSASGTDAGVVLLRRQSGDFPPQGPSAADVRSASGTDAGVVLLRRQSGDLALPGTSAADVRSASGTDDAVGLLPVQSGDLPPPGPSAGEFPVYVETAVEQGSGGAGCVG
ncbi:myb-related transcription factor, partner of profilin-like [Hyperolius riggenbachi]|uniref:myb-related transcription factor, partner of profilin-like n=1 Tax=Hyperolius riggenbachi TaxID=752182 RepID=UPI0035A32083